MSLKDDETLTRTLIRARMSIATTIEEVGPCDHEANICCCDDIRLVASIDEMIFTAFGIAMIDQFYYAANGMPTTEKNKWGRAALDAMVRMGNEQLRDVAESAEEP